MRYAAFISYSHEADIHRAQHVRQALHTFAKPWNSLRALRVFLDNAALSADPALWTTVEQALGESEHLIFFASPQSARSPWVDREVAWWRHSPRARKLLLVVTGGELYWDHARGDFDPARSTCLPPSLYGFFEAEPRWVDLRWMGEDDSGDLRDPRFRACIADLAAPLHGRPKDELIGEDISQRRRFRRFRQGMLAGITALAVIASATAVYAFLQRNIAQHQARIATARQLAATAANLSGDDLEAASLLALQGYHVAKTPETLSALYQMTIRSPHLTKFVHSDAKVTALALTPSARYAAVGTEKGSVTVWSADGTRKAGRLSLSGGVSGLTFSGDGQLVAAGTTSGEVAVLDLASHKERRLSGGTEEVPHLRFRPRSHVLATADDGGELRLYGPDGRDPVSAVAMDTGPVDLAFSDNGTKIAVIYMTGSALYDGKLRRLQAWTDPVYPGDAHFPAVSPSGTCFGFAKYDSLYLGSTDALGHLDIDRPGNCAAQPTLPDREITNLALSDSNKVAVGTSKGLTLALAEASDAEDGSTSGKVSVEELPGVKEPSVLTFSPGSGDRLASANGRTVALWDLNRSGLTMHHHNVTMQDSTEAVSPPSLAAGPDGAIALSYGSDDYTLSVMTPEGVAQGHQNDSVYYGLAFSPDGDNLYTVSSNNRVDTWVRAPGSLKRVATHKVPLVADTRLTDVAARRDGRVVALRTDGSTVLVDPSAKGDPPQVEDSGTYDFEKDHQGALGEDGTLLAVESERSLANTPASHVDLLELPSRRRMRRIGLGGALSALAVSVRTHSLFTVIDENVLQSWDTRTGKLRWQSDGAGYAGIDIDPSGHWIATVSGDGTVWFWDSATGGRLAGVDIPFAAGSRATSLGTGWQSSIAFSDDGKQLWSATEGGELLSWDMTTESWIKGLCGRVSRELSPAERSRYLTSVSGDYQACTPPSDD
ncbi:toll/interleukin-1 receptor domain-containing protein [Streptomyces longwoodensis]|uniref:toll/interleukin-1 receptor domain-containing protein n=1 Tax=Streptomyces longwoodensis TaxID=68231 RepID=UPI0033BFF9DA